MTPEEKEKEKLINDWKIFWDLFPVYMDKQWRKIPLLIRSFLKIAIWVLMDALLIIQMPPISKWGWSDVPLIYITTFFTSLGIFCTYCEIKMQWERYKRVKSTDKAKYY